MAVHGTRAPQPLSGQFYDGNVWSIQSVSIPVPVNRLAKYSVSAKPSKPASCRPVLPHTNSQLAEAGGINFLIDRRVPIL